MLLFLKISQVLCLYQWTNTYLLKSKKPVHVVRYENLKTDLRAELRKILTFLNRTISEKNLDCVERSTGEKWHRKKSDFDPYSKMDKNILKRLEDAERTVVNKANKRTAK